MKSPDSHLCTVEIVVASSETGQRLDSYLGAHPEVNLSRSKVRKLMDDDLVLVNDEHLPAKYKTRENDRIVLTIPPPTVQDIVAEDIPIEVLYEDEYLAVINKPAGMATHPGRGHHTGTLVNAIMYRFEALSAGSDVVRPWIVHRLDKDTTGLLMIAKSDSIHLKLQDAIRDRDVERSYVALVCGHMLKTEGEINLPIGRSPKVRTKMMVDGVDSREAITRYRRLERFRSYDLVEAKLLTGRTHQIRVHFSHLGHPVFGDHDYGGREARVRGMFAPERPLARKMLELIGRQALHARRLEFDHPVTGVKLTIEADFPDDFQTVLDLLSSGSG